MKNRVLVPKRSRILSLKERDDAAKGVREIFADLEQWFQGDHERSEYWVLSAIEERIRKLFYEEYKRKQGDPDSVAGLYERQDGAIIEVKPC